MLKEKKHSANFSTYKLLSYLYLLSSDYSQALECSRKALKLSKKIPSSMSMRPEDIYTQLEAIYLAAGDTSNAEKIIREKIDGTKEVYQSADDYVELARYQLHRNDTADAIKSCETALEINPMNTNAFTGLATIHILQNDMQQAKDDLYKIAAYDKDENERLQTLNAIIWMETGNYNSAYYSLKKALEINEEFETAQKLMETYFSF